MPRDENIAAQEHLANNINEGNVDAGVETFAEDAVDHDPAPGQGAGREGFKTFFQTLLIAFPDAHIEPAHMVADGPVVLDTCSLSPYHGLELQVIRHGAELGRRRRTGRRRA